MRGIRVGLTVYILVVAVSADAAAQRLLVCGSAQVLDGTIEADHDKQTFVTNWAWRPENSHGLPLRMRANFAGTDECKPVDSGKSILITSSGDAVALVSRKSGDTLFYATVRNAHSAALLPGGLLVVASSFSPDGSGDRLLLFNRSLSNRVLATLLFAGAHGVEWDSSRHVLWALGDRELARIRIADDDGTAKMVMEHTFRLPARGGHDLVLAHDHSVLYLTTSRDVFTFNPASETFSPFTPFHAITNVKSLSINSKTGQIMYTQAGHGVWWTYELNFLNPSARVILTEHAYKARWSPN
jgi:hypothetical protein